MGASGGVVVLLVAAAGWPPPTPPVRQTLRHLLTPDELRGRMTSVNMIFFMGGPQLGEFEAWSRARSARASR